MTIVIKSFKGTNIVLPDFSCLKVRSQVQVKLCFYSFEMNQYIRTVGAHYFNVLI